MKLSISGWPGGGSSTLALILCKMLDIKLIRGGELFRHIYRKASFVDEGQQRVDAHNEIEPHMGPIIDKFIDFAITSGEFDNFLIESDITAFRVGKRNDFFSIFLLTDKSVRASRTATDGRKSDGDVIDEVDSSHEKVYFDLHGIKWFDDEMIRDRHALVFDNSEISIEDELVLVFESMRDHGMLEAEEMEILVSRCKFEDEYFWANGKDDYKEYLIARDQLMSSEEMIVNLKKYFPEDIARLPKGILRLLD